MTKRKLIYSVVILTFIWFLFFVVNHAALMKGLPAQPWSHDDTVTVWLFLALIAGLLLAYVRPIKKKDDTPAEPNKER